MLKWAYWPSGRAIIESIRVPSLLVTKIQTVDFISTLLLFLTNNVIYFQFQFPLVVCLYTVVEVR